MGYRRLLYVLWAFASGLVLVLSILVSGGCANTASKDNQRLIGPLPDFPLALGNTWVYSSTYYDTYLGERITATYLVTETVVDAQMHAPYCVSQISRETVVMSSSMNLDELHSSYLNGGGGEESYWYIISGTQVYRQSGELNLADIESAWLEYVFPLSENTWYPDGERRQIFPDPSNGPVPGKRGARGPISKRVPAGEFESCFDVWTIYNSGGTESWFCLEIGPIGGEYAHHGTPFGYKTVLVDYWIQSP